MSHVMDLQRVLWDNESGFKGLENASVKEYVHVRINISGSPLEFPGQIFLLSFHSSDAIKRGYKYIFFLCLVDVLFVCSETFPSIGRVRVKHRGILLTVKGTVIRSGAIKMMEGERLYECRRCKCR